MLFGAFDISAHQETEVHLSIYHYFLWKAAVEKVKGHQDDIPVNEGATTTSPSVMKPSHVDRTRLLHNTDDKNESIATTTADNRTKDDVSISRSITAADAAAKDGVHVAQTRCDSFQRVADVLVEQFPQQVQFFTAHFHLLMHDSTSRPPLPPPPIVTTLYQDFPRLQTDLTAAQNRIDQLEKVVVSKHFETTALTNELTRLRLQKKMSASVASTVLKPISKRKARPNTAVTTSESGTKRSRRNDVAAQLGAVNDVAAGLKLQAMESNTKKRGASSGVHTDPAVDAWADTMEGSEGVTSPKRLKLFEERVQELEHFRKGNGHCRVPHSFPGLGRWVQDMRRCYRDSKVSKEHIAVLEVMGFEWSVKEPIVPWEQRFETLIKFKEEHGHCNVSRGYKKDPRLGEFVHMQRNCYRERTKSLMKPPEGGGKSRAQKLEEIGFIWHTGKVRPTFEERIEECRDFRRQHDHLRVPLTAKCDGDDTPESADTRSFCAWAQRQREEYRRFNDGMKTTLNKSRIRKLDEMGFDWNFDEGATGVIRGKAKDNVTFISRIAQLADINEKYGDCNNINVLRAAGHPKSSPLYQWMKRQRKAWKSLHAGQWTWLDSERIALLESVKFNFEPYKHRLPYGSRKEAAETQANGDTGKLPHHFTLPTDQTNPSSDEDEDEEDDGNENGSCPSIDNERYRTF